MAFYKNSPASVGNTPLIKLNHVVDSMANVLVKVEGRNPSYSVKCRIGVSMIDDAEKRGVLKPGGSIVEATSGNTGIALAYVAAARGYKLTLTMPETMSSERRKLFALLGANVVLTPGAAGMGGQGGAIQRAKEIAQAEGAFMPLQFENPANPEIHEKTTGPEIWADTNGGIDVLVAGVGTGGTISGITRYIKKTQGKSIISVAVEPTSSPVISQHLAGQEIKPGPHKIQGIGAGFIPQNLDLSLIDKVVKVDSDEAIAFTRLLAQKEGLLVGISSGASALAAKRLAEQPEFSGKTIVAILPDLAERYISTGLFGGIGA